MINGMKAVEIYTRTAMLRFEQMDHNTLDLVMAAFRHGNQRTIVLTLDGDDPREVTLRVATIDRIDVLG